MVYGENAASAFDPGYSTRSGVRAIRFAFGTSWRYSPARTISLIALPVVIGLLPAAMALVLRSLVNIVASGGPRSDAVLYLVINLGLAYVLAMLVPLRITLEKLNEERLGQELTVQMLRHADTLDFAYFESPRFRDHIAQSVEDPGKVANGLIAQTAATISSTMTVGSLVALLGSIEPRLLIWLPPVAIPYLFHRWSLTRVRFVRIRTLQRSKRWADYFSASLYDEQRLPESRLLNLSSLFTDRVDNELGKIVGASRKVFIRELISSLVFNAIALGVVYFALWQVIQDALAGELTVGDVAIFAGAVGALRTAIDVLVLSIGRVRWNVLNVCNVEYFLELPAQFPGLDPPDPATVAKLPTSSAPLSIQNLSFSYPETETPVLVDVSFDVKAGETVALVGENGSGKTTLAKLIIGLYPPNEGRVMLQGTPSHELDREEIQSLVSVVFQQYGTFEASAFENIGLGDWRRLLDNHDEIEQIATQTGLDALIDKLPDGYETQLGRSFGSMALSGGQQQLFAVGRSFARDVPIMILDEPTASLDAATEYKMFQNFKHLAQGRATLLVSHRFSTLGLADRIVVLKDGRTAEQGTHDELMAADGQYARMYRQSQTGTIAALETDS